MTGILKKYPVMTTLIALAMTQLIWFKAAPGNFKMTWRKNPVVANIIRQHDLVEEKAKDVAISYYLPYFKYWGDIVAGIQQPKKELMESYYLGKSYIFHTYYQKAVELFPKNGTTHFLLGFCEYYMGNVDKARVQFEESIELEPFFFWSYYDLGRIYFQQGEYLKSAEVLNRALALRKIIALSVLRQDFLFQQIWQSVANPSRVLENNLDQGHKDAMLLMASCLIKAGGVVQALKLMQSFGLDSPWHRELSVLIIKMAVAGQGSTEIMDQLVEEQIPVRLF